MGVAEANVVSTLHEHEVAMEKVSDEKRQLQQWEGQVCHVLSSMNFTLDNPRDMQLASRQAEVLELERQAAVKVSR